MIINWYGSPEEIARLISEQKLMNKLVLILYFLEWKYLLFFRENKTTAI